MKRLPKPITILLFVLCFILLMSLSILDFLSNNAGAPEEETEPVVNKVEEIDNQKYEKSIESAIKLSENQYFYSDTIKVELSTEKPSQIYYTLDGSTPTASSTKYSKPISLKSANVAKCYPLSAIAIYEDGTRSECLHHTYLISSKITNRFNTLVFCITVEPQFLWDYDTGIFTPGRIQDEYLAANPDAKIDWSTPGNYSMRGKKSERAMYFEVFSPDGTCVISQNAGMRTYGGASRTQTQKSVKLFARKSYDENNKNFKYSFFPDLINVEGDIEDKFDKLVVRNCGNDLGFAFIRDELNQRLGKLAGFPDTEAVTPCCMYINGKYYGFYWLHENYCNKYFKTHYGDYTGEFYIVEGTEVEKVGDEETEEAEQKAIDDYNTIYEKYSQADLLDEKTYQELCSVIDIENYLSYYAINLYIDNTDWPHNNYKAYRYYASDDVYTEGTAFDGKWRYLLHDMDYSMGLYDSGYMHSDFATLASGEQTKECNAPLFCSLLQRKDCCTNFIKRMLSLANGTYAYSNLNPVLTAMDAERINEIAYSYKYGLWADWIDSSNTKRNLETIRDFVMNRPKYMIYCLEDYYDASEYELSVTIPSGVSVDIDYYHATSNFTGKYLTEYPVTISAVVPTGMTFDHWEVNGEVISDQTFDITEENIEKDKCNITLVMK